jgi:RimJ/RimL family protein N-acetyltransferase
MAINFWQGELVRLRGIEPEDWQTVYDWNLDSGMIRHLDYVWPPQSKAAVRQWAERVATERPQNDSYFWGIENLAGELVGAISTHDCDARAGNFEYGVSIREEHRRKGYAAEAIGILMRFFFEELRYQKATIHVHSNNEPSIRLHQRLGFVEEGKLRRVVYTSGRYYDEFIFGMTAEEFAAKQQGT